MDLVGVSSDEWMMPLRKYLPLHRRMKCHVTAVCAAAAAAVVLLESVNGTLRS